MAELKPCPFCGGTARLKEHRFYYDKDSSFSDCSYGIRCSNCFAESYQFHQSKEKAIEAWNRRVPQTEVHQYGENCTHISNCGTLNLNL